jgi:hypothetical protein
MAKLTRRASKWLKIQSPAVTNQLIELAAGDHWLALRIAQNLDLPHPDRSTIPAGRRVKVSDDELIQLRDRGLSQGAIGDAVGLSRQQVCNRLKKIKENE